MLAAIQTSQVELKRMRGEHREESGERRESYSGQHLCRRVRLRTRRERTVKEFLGEQTRGALLQGARALLESIIELNPPTVQSSVQQRLAQLLEGVGSLESAAENELAQRFALGQYAATRVAERVRELNAVCLEHLDHHALYLSIEAVKVEHALQSTANRLVGVLLEVANHVHELTRRVRIREQFLVAEVAQLGKRTYQPMQGFLRHVGAVAAQHHAFRVWIGVGHRMTGEHIAHLGEEVIAQKRIAGPIGECDHTKARMNRETGRIQLFFVRMTVEVGGRRTLLLLF
mmetsp:Transcript_11931/g.36317  ORF Transcript_11931/g.36317 Transcript_11931/m.36317 type:complete len:288 (+) Transcript_11931:2409-3272(+)